MGRKGKNNSKKNLKQVPKLDPPLQEKLKQVSRERAEKCVNLFIKYTNMEPSEKEIPINDIISYKPFDSDEENCINEEEESEEENLANEDDDEIEQVEDEEEIIVSETGKSSDKENQLPNKQMNKKPLNIEHFDPTNVTMDKETKNLIEDNSKNLKDIFLARQVSIILDSKELYEIDTIFKEEIRKLINHVEQEDLLSYLASLLSLKESKETLHLIENVFDSRIKYYLTEREAAKSEEDYEYWKRKVQNEWKSLNEIMDEQSVLAYCLAVLRPMRNPWLFGK